jgi:glycerophosphoryl diester phosphodiesterase
LSTRNPSALIIGHRGASAFAPENTLAAFARALADGADGIEFDVRLTRDGVPVVIHDRTLQHAARKKAAVANITSSRLAEIDIGSWFNRRHPRFARLHYSRQTVPALDDVLCFLLDQAGQDFVAYVEMKTGRSKTVNEALAAAVVTAITRRSLQRRTVVIGFNLATVAKVKKLDGSIRTGALFGPRQRATRSIRKMVEAAISCGAEEILFHRLLASPSAIARARDKGLVAVVWTVDDPNWVERATNLGLHALITNNPAKMRS